MTRFDAKLIQSLGTDGLDDISQITRRDSQSFEVRRAYFVARRLCRALNYAEWALDVRAFP